MRERAFFAVPDGDRPLHLIANIEPELRGNSLRRRKIVEIEQLHGAASIGMQAVHEAFDAAAHGRAVRIDANARAATLLTHHQTVGGELVERPLGSNAGDVELRGQLLLAGKKRAPRYCPS